MFSAARATIVVSQLSRRAHGSTPSIEYVVGDLAKEEGVEAAVEGAQIVVPRAGSGKIGNDSAQIRHLMRAANPEKLRQPTAFTGRRGLRRRRLRARGGLRVDIYRCEIDAGRPGSDVDRGARLSWTATLRLR
jgi:hypothetical protein